MFCAAAWVHGYSGFGFGIICMALMAFLPMGMERASVVVSLTGFVILVVLVFISRGGGRVRWDQVLLLIPGGVLGVPLGYRFISAFGDQPVFRFVLGGALMIFAVLGARKRGKTPRALPGWAALPIGLISGFIGGAFVTGGPPIVMYLYSRTRDPRDMKATIQATFMALSATRIATIALGEKGLAAEGTLRMALIFLPFVVAALIMGHRLSLGHSVDFFRKVVNGLIFLMGLSIVVQTALKLL
jgi:uncharacterized membrane protein YfcA